MISQQTYEATLAKLFTGGQTLAFPRRRQDQLVLLAAVAISLSKGGPYGEEALNERLSAWLAGMEKKSSLDHVTLRRYLVDFDFLRRDAAGKAYEVNRALLQAEFASPVLDLDPHTVVQEARIAREARKRAWQGS